jgi:hypothetical protein
MGERDDPGIAEQQVVARHQHDEDADFCRRFQRRVPGNRNGAKASEIRMTSRSTAADRCAAYRRKEA